MYRYTKVQFRDRKDHSDVIIYYSKDGEKFRPNTGVRVLSKHITASGNLSSQHPNFIEDSRKIKELQDRVEKLVSDHVEQYGEKPTVAWLEKQFAKPKADAKKNQQDALHYWPAFIEEKEKVLRNEGTIKRYNNLRDTLSKFEKKRNLDITFDYVDQDFFNSFFDYMINEHEYVRNTKQKEPGSMYIPEVGLANETAIKRVKDLVEYLKYCTVEHDIAINLEKIKKYIKLSRHKLQIKPLSKTQKWELTLDTEELEFVVNLEVHEQDFYASLSDNQRRYLDIAIFMGLQGTAPIDAKSIKRQDIVKGKITKDRGKTGNEFKVELDPIAEEILVRNSYNLDFVDQTFNDEIKKLFVTIFELYRKHYEKRHKELYEMICVQKTKKGNKDVFKIQHRGLFVEGMTFRRSFLTNLGEKAGEMGIKELMSKAGHTEMMTTLGYIHSRQNTKKEKEKNDLFGIRKLKKK